MKKAATPARYATAAIENELSELGEECDRVSSLLEQLALARARGRDTSEILGELSAAVLHLHAHTKGMDERIDELAEG